MKFIDTHSVDRFIVCPTVALIMFEAEVLNAHPLSADPLLPGGTKHSGSRRCRICFATNNVAGIVRNGAATANSALAMLLADHKHDVTILYTSPPPSPSSELAEAKATYEARGVKLIFIGGENKNYLEHLAQAFFTYLHLSELNRLHPFDVIHFTECQGHGYYCLQAKAAGTDFAGTTLAVTTHGSLRWCHEGNLRELFSGDEFATDIIERRCIELADVLISPSCHMMDWILNQGWKLPVRRHIQQYVLPVQESHSPPAAESLTEIIFFGRQEIRKGLHIFLDALEKCRRQFPLGIKITFLGESSVVNGLSSSEYIAGKLQGWTGQWSVIDDFDHSQALEYLQGAGRMAVIASIHDNLPNTVLECLALRVPLICSRAGGIPEMIHQDDLAECSYASAPDPAENLAESLKAAFRRGRLVIPRFRISPSETNTGWLQWHSLLAQKAAETTITPQQGVAALAPRIDLIVRGSDAENIESFRHALPSELAGSIATSIMLFGR